MKLLSLNLPSTPKHTIVRDYAGGFGIGVPNITPKLKRHSTPHLNLFLPYSAAVAKEAGWEYDLLDAQTLNLSKRDIIKNVQKYNPNIIFSMISLPSINNDKDILMHIKTEIPNSIIVGCGAVCNSIPIEVLNDSGIDFIVQDIFPYVKSLSYLLNLHKINIYKNKIIAPHIFLLQKDYTFYTPNFSKISLDLYRNTTIEGRKKEILIPILASRGCSHNCYYCPYPQGFGDKYKFMNPIKVVDHIEMFYNKGVNNILFRNQSFTYNKKWAEKICNEIVKRKIEISWYCEARVDEISHNILDLMHLSGCKKINFGVETGDPTLLKSGKPGVIITDIKRAFTDAKKHNMSTGAHVILGLPGENIDTLKITEKMLLELNADSIHINIATPYPGTRMYEIADKNNWIITKKWENYNSFKVIIKLDDIDPEILIYKSYQIKHKYMKKRLMKKIHNADINKVKDILYDISKIILNRYSLHVNLQNYKKM